MNISRFRLSTAISRSPVLNQSIIACLLLSALIGLQVVGGSNFGVFHFLGEMFSIVVAASLFLLVWNARKVIVNQSLVALGIAFLFVAILNMVHTLTYPGMQVFEFANDHNISTQFRIAANWINSLSLLLFTAAIGRAFTAHPSRVLLFYSSATAAIVVSIFVLRIFPDCYRPGSGFTLFKDASEYASCLILAVAGLLIGRSDRFPNPAVRNVLCVALATASLSAFAFSFDDDAYEATFNFAAHYFKFISFYLIYLALIRSSLTAPYETLFAELSSARKSLERSLRQFKLLAESAGELLRAPEPLTVMESICRRVAEHLSCDSFLLFLSDGPGARMRLHACAGVSEDKAAGPTDGIECTHSASPDAEGGSFELGGLACVPPHTEWLASLGIRGFISRSITGADEGLSGVLIFGSRAREAFDLDDRSIAEAIANQMSEALRRMQVNQALRDSREALQRSNERLEEKVLERTTALAQTVSALKDEVSRRQQAQAELRQLSRVFMDAADPIIITDPDGVIRDLNREAEVSYGWARKDLIGRSFDALLAPERHRWWHCLRDRCRAGEELRNVEEVLIDSHGQAHSVLMTAFPMMEEDQAVSGIATITKDITLRKHMETDLRASQDALRELSRKSIEALESDRQTVAREVHDGIAGNLSALKFSLEIALRRLKQEANPQAAAVSAIVDDLADTIRESKRIAANLRPLSIDDLGLLATIDWYIKQSAERYPDIRLGCEVNVEEAQIPETQKLVIYRIVQESLANAFRHSRADQIWVSLARKKDFLEISIQDNGMGFDYQDVLTRKNRLGGFGLRSMQERTEIAGGSLWVVSQPEGGTNVTALLPLS